MESDGIFGRRYMFQEESIFHSPEFVLLFIGCTAIMII